MTALTLRGSASSILIVMLCAGVCGCITTDWNETQTKGTREGYEAFVARYPDSSYSSRARARIATFKREEEENRRRIDKAVTSGDVHGLYVMKAGADEISKALKEHWTPLAGDSPDSIFLKSTLLPLMGNITSMTDSCFISSITTKESQSYSAVISKLTFDKNIDFAFFPKAIIGGRSFETMCYYQGVWFAKTE